MTRGTKVLMTVTALAMFALTPQRAQAQENADYQAWTALLGGANLDKAVPGLRIWFDGHTRRGDAGTVFIVRPGLGYQFAPWISAWVGYGWIPVAMDESGERLDEQRIWQQLILKRSFFGTSLNTQSRTRVEQRFLENSPQVAHRVRQFVRADTKLGASPVGLVLWDELFWGLNDVDGFVAQGFDQNRIFVGPAFYAFDGFRVEVGYLNAVLRRNEAIQVQHALALNFFVSL